MCLHILFLRQFKAFEKKNFCGQVQGVKHAKNAPLKKNLAKTLHGAFHFLTLTDSPNSQGGHQPLPLYQVMQTALKNEFDQSEVV
jgi:hypothetical protein